MPENIFTQWVKYMESQFLKKPALPNNEELNFQESRGNQPVLKSWPTRCYLEITNQCNLRCSMCGQSWFEGKRTYIPDEVLAKVRELYPHLKEISVFGFGESLVDKRFFDILSDIPDHILTKYVSNGLLITRENAEKLITQGLDELYISIDAATPETYKFVRGVQGFERIIENIRGLVELKKQLNSPTPVITMAYTFYRRTAEEFLDFIRLAHSLGVQKVSGDYLIVYRKELVEESLFFDQELGNKVFRDAKALAQELGIELVIPKSFEEARQEESTDSGMIPCYEPWEFVYFRSDGHIGPCCVNDIKLGDLNTQSFENIWNSNTYQNFRKMVNTTRSNVNCAQCMGKGMRKITDRSFHIKFLDKEGKVVTEENKSL